MEQCERRRGYFIVCCSVGWGHKREGHQRESCAGVVRADAPLVRERRAGERSFACASACDVSMAMSVCRVAAVSCGRRPWD